jgi:hypothetical protein
MALQRDRREKSLELKAWWLEQMRVTSSPLTEKMTRSRPRSLARTTC